MAHEQARLPLLDGEPHPLAVIDYPPVLPVKMEGGSEVDQVCGGCSAIMFEGFRDLTHYHVDFQWIVVCPECGAKNDLPATVYPMTDKPW